MAKSSIVVAISSVILTWIGILPLSEEKKIALDQLPPAVMKSIKDKFPGGKIEEATKEVKDGQAIFEIEVETNSVEYTVSLKEDGTILEIEKEIDAKGLPAAVAATVKAEFPIAKLKEIEEVTKGDKITYELQVVEAGKKTLEVVLDAQGKILEKKDAEED